MVKIKLNDFSYRYDVYHIFKLFYSFIDIQFVDEDFDFSVAILDDRVEILNKKNEAYNFKLPNKLKKSNEI
ncbi:MAG: coproporphyrinogen dehydrogenase HemZ, partial [Clostridiaceae bacterium]